jgi:hypothetical protein
MWLVLVVDVGLAISSKILTKMGMARQSEQRERRLALVGLEALFKFGPGIFHYQLRISWVSLDTG